MDKVIIIGKWKKLEIFKSGGWVDGEFQPELKTSELNCVVNPMSYKTLQTFESGKYTTQDLVAYSKDIIDIKGTHTYMTDKLGTRTKYYVDDVKTWDDADLVKYILKRAVNE